MPVSSLISLPKLNRELQGEYCRRNPATPENPSKTQQRIARGSRRRRISTGPREPQNSTENCKDIRVQEREDGTIEVTKTQQRIASCITFSSLFASLLAPKLNRELQVYAALELPFAEAAPSKTQQRIASTEYRPLPHVGQHHYRPKLNRELQETVYGFRALAVKPSIPKTQQRIASTYCR